MGMEIDSDKDLVEWIDEHGKGLTPFEVEFIEDMMKRVDTLPLSSGQRRLLEKIYEERCT